LPNRRTAVVLTAAVVLLATPLAQAQGPGDPLSAAEGEDGDRTDPKPVGPFVQSNGPTPIDWLNATTNVDVDPNETSANASVVLVLGPTTNDEGLDEDVQDATSPVLPESVYEERARSETHADATVEHPVSP